jgi:hypothetical protein
MRSKAVILVCKGGQRDRAYWLDIQAYFAESSTADLFLAGETVNVRISVAQRFTRRAVQLIIQRKNASQAHFQGKG